MRLLPIFLTLSLTSPSLADTSPCHGTVKELTASIEANDGTVTVMSPSQWQFLRGLYVGLPPADGLPYGDSALLLEVPAVANKDPVAAIFFTAGPLVCNNMAVFPWVVKILKALDEKSL